MSKKPIIINTSTKKSLHVKVHSKINKRVTSNNMNTVFNKVEKVNNFDEHEKKINHHKPSHQYVHIIDDITDINNQITTLYKLNDITTQKFNDTFNKVQTLNNHNILSPNNQYNLTFLNIIINSLNINDDINCITCGRLKHITKTYVLTNFKMTDLSGIILMSGLGDLSNCDIGGDLFILATDTNIMYQGIIYKKNNDIKYTLSNRPIIPIGISMNIIMYINFKVIMK